MEKEFKGVFGKTWWSLPFAASNVIGLMSGDRLKVADDKLLVSYKGKDVELPKSQIQNVKDIFFWGAIKIVNTNQSLPNNLIFYPLFSIGPLRTSTISKVLKSSGYIN